MVRVAGRSSAGAQLSAEQRAWLGLEETESVRVLASGSRTILLEREGGSAAAALPWDRDLVLTADIRAFSLVDVLQLVHESTKSGFLFFEDRDHAKSVYLNRGEVVFAASNQAADRLGECLLRNGVITPEQLREARCSYSPPEHFGKILVERRFLTPHQLWNGVKLQVEEIVRSLFSYGAGTVLLWEGEVWPDNVVRLSLPTGRLISEGLKRRDEFLKLLAWLEDPRTRLQPLAAGKLSGTERLIFEAIDGKEGFAGVCRRAGVDPLSGARTVQLLRLLGAVDIVREEETPGEARDPEPARGDDDAVRECVGMHLKLMAELTAPVVAVEGAEGIRERLGGIVEEASRRFPQILSGVEVGPGGALDPEEITGRALRFPGERECEVRSALGELVSYLEFELLNHPRVPEPEQFLEGLEELRSTL